ncbi:tetratricopeptide repeat protein [Methylocystis echinoides]|uniref:tetratricopeptide repeat protein n=1 Tax=Methylocystis echinoides TaxID=29468 RepID=UPI00248F69A6|nr:tetratricopeptide repeat protein [Methylocystis echinoides]
MTTSPLAPSRLCVLSLAAVALLSLSACNRRSLDDVTGSVSAARLPSDEDALRRYADELGQRYDRNPKDKSAALAYAKALHALDQNAQAVAVMQGLAITYPEDMKVLAAYGKALADAGKLQQATEVLDKAHTPERPDWSVLSTQGSIADQLGNHDSARGYYETALKIRPNEPTVLSNLGLSYALAKNLPRAEETLRLAAAQPAADRRVRQNLALVLALQGKFQEAEDLSRRDLSPEDAAQNVAAIRQLISQSDTWREIQTGATKKARPRVAAPSSPARAGNDGSQL